MEQNFIMESSGPLFTNDAVVLGILIFILAVIFKTQKMKAFEKFYKYVPALLLCYFIPSFFNSLGIISAKTSSLYFVSSRFLLPASLVLLTISIDLKKIVKLGPKALIMFFTGTFGIVIGGPLTFIIVNTFFPQIFAGHGAEASWRGMTTIAATWIGGGANQVAMKEVFEVSDYLFSALVTIDVFIGSIWLAVLLYGVGMADKIDRFFKADTTAIDEIKVEVEKFQKQSARIPDLTDLMVILAIGFGVTGICHFCADIISPFLTDLSKSYPFIQKMSLTSKFFWLIVLATTIGLILSFTKVRNLEGAGASRVGSVFIYMLVATIGMNMDIRAIFLEPGFFLVGTIWMLIHAVLLIVVGKIIRAPFFFLAVGSQANIGGAASAPVVASAFHPSLAPVGVMIAVLGYALGTYGAYICGLLMQAVAP